MTNNKKYYPWIVVALLWGVALLNYMDRQMLSTMKSAMMIDITELESATNFGRLMAVFLWIYGLMSPVAGMIADRINRIVRQMDSAECTGTHLYRFHRACLDHSGTPAVRIRRQFRHDCRRRTLFRYRFRYFRRQQHADPLPVRIATLPGDRLRHYEHDRGICWSDHHKTVGRVDGCR